jgi:hypothetical protein
MGAHLGKNEQFLWEKVQIGVVAPDLLKKKVQPL